MAKVTWAEGMFFIDVDMNDKPELWSAFQALLYDNNIIPYRTFVTGGRQLTCLLGHRDSIAVKRWLDENMKLNSRSR